MRVLWTLAAIGMVALAGLGPARASGAGPDAASSSASAAPAGSLYVPPPPAKRLEGGRAGGGTRSIRQPVCAARPVAMVPEDHGGFTAEAAPTLWYFLSADVGCSVRFVLKDRRQEPSLLEASVAAAGRAGFHAIRLTDLGVTLAPGVDYDWLVEVMPATEDSRPGAFSGGPIRRIERPAALDAELAAAGASRAEILGHRSLWYDAVTAVFEEIQTKPGDVELQRQRSLLLDVVGRDAAAGADHRAP
jgi:hypothetical protein